MTCGKFVGDRFTLYARIFLVVLNIAALSFLINALTLQNYFYTDGFGSFPDGLALAPVGWSLLWTGIALAINFCGTAYHPGIDVAMELVAWGLVVGTVWLLIWSVSILGPYSDNMCSYWHEGECTETRANLLRASEIIASVAIIVSGAMHFWLFIKACLATHRRRLEDLQNRTRIIELEERVTHLEAQVKRDHK